LSKITQQAALEDGLKPAGIEVPDLSQEKYGTRFTVKYGFKNYCRLLQLRRRQVTRQRNSGILRQD
jgi:hypothetical protein